MTVRMMGVGVMKGRNDGYGYLVMVAITKRGQLPIMKSLLPEEIKGIKPSRENLSLSH